MSGLFGSANTGGGSSLFGNKPTNTNNAAPTGSSLFGNPAPASSAPASTSLFGSTLGNNNQQTQNQNTSSLFGGPGQQQNPNQAGASLFGSQQPQPPPPQQQQHPQQSGFAPLASGLQFPAHLSLAQQQDLARSRLQQAGLSSQRVDEKGIIDQAQTLVRKWDPNSQDTLLQAYLYNAVNAAYAPFYNRNPDEKEEAWEKALSEAPKLEPEDGGGTLKFVPVLVRGFKALGDRVRFQSQTLDAMQERLHEMNNSLNAVMQTHQQNTTVRLEASRRQHVALANRTLRLAVKLQILRNRGYALDAAEEALRKQLLSLSSQVSDPAFAAREEEIWARMVALRERARWLEEEGKRLGAQVQESNAGGSGGGVPEHVLEKTKKILADYDGQLRHLARELAEVGKEFQEFEEMKRVRERA